MMKKIISIMAGGVLLAATMSGCVDDNPTFVIRGLVPISSTCEAGSDTDETIAQELHYILNEEVFVGVIITVFMKIEFKWCMIIIP